VESNQGEQHTGCGGSDEGGHSISSLL
jgi:hypothetical protein